jgi:hypothetical protein
VSAGSAKVQAYAETNGLPPAWHQAKDVDERRALEVARCAHSAVCDTALVCGTAGLDGTEVKDALRDASQALLRLIAVIEGR